ncbi:MAG: DUF2189 domain-containing protein [Paracoccaceae bacterium]|jgi:uncharacterized membrane protein
MQIDNTLNRNQDRIKDNGFPEVRKMNVRDVTDALRLGIADFKAKPSQLVFVYVFYPFIAFFAARVAFGMDVIPLLFPLSGGIALVGPAVAVVFYEVSRRRERGMDTSWRHALRILKSPVMLSVAALSLMLLAIFVVWLYIASSIYGVYFGGEEQTSIVEFTKQVFVTAEGWSLIFVGCSAGFALALIVLATSAVSFPLLIDRDIGPIAAVSASIRVAWKNPIPVAAWGLIVAVVLFLGTVLAFIGLAISFPILGHATWHFYRKSIVWQDT